MRKTGPVTGRQITLNSDDQLVTSTTTKGVITFCNDRFCDVAGYSREQLLGQAHNIVRHPDMPPEAFSKMWSDLKAGNPWMGLVKNRCSNCDHYWVDAYVTPVSDQGEILGYESVRVAPTQEQIDRAELAYARLRSGKPAVPMITSLWGKLRNYILVSLSIFVVLICGFLIIHDVEFLTGLMALVASIIAGTISVKLLSVPLKRTLKQSRETIYDPLAAYIYTGRSDIYGEILLATAAQKARLRTALGRFNEAARELLDKSTAAQTEVEASLENMNAQQKESSQVAESMGQMAEAVQEVASGVSQTSNATVDAMKEVKNGEQVLVEANREIGQLSSTVTALSSVLENLSGGSAKIASVIDVIRAIADQTNLLALNAAIEAARAGEQGRGFSVVADEVRSLAQRTQESTQDIQIIIEELGKATTAAVSSMDSCQESSSRSVDRIENVNNALKRIAESVMGIEKMSHQIAAAAEEQSAAASEVNTNTRNISDIAKVTQDKAAVAASLSGQMSELAERQFLLVERFK